MNQNYLTPFMPPWMPIAIKELGVSEIPGNLHHNPRIIQYHQATTLKATTDEVPWCAAFVNWCLQQCNLKGTNKANARSFLNLTYEIDLPAYGCIAILKRGNNEFQGHVGFVVYDGKDQIMLLGGNQGDKVSIKPFKKSDLLGLRWM